MRNSGRGRAEQQIAAALVEHFARLQRHVDLATGVVEPHGSGLFDEIAVEMLVADHLRMVALRLEFETTAPARMSRPLTSHALHAAACWTSIRSTSHLIRTSTPLCQQLLVHQRDQPVGASLEREHALGHEVREDDAVGDRRVFERGAVGVGDRLHQQANHVLAAREKPLEQARGRSPIGRRRSSSRGRRRRRPARFRSARGTARSSSRVKSSRLNVVVSENIGLSKRMFLSCTIESAISRVQ